MAATSSAHADLLPDTTIAHAAASSFTVNERTVLEARLTDSENITDARCYFKADQDRDYLYMTMHELTENSFQCIVPAFGPGVASIEYFFLVVNGRGQVIRSTPYLISEPGTAAVPGSCNGDAAVEQLELYSELGNTERADTSITDNRIILVATQQSNQLYGLRAGVYDQNDIPDSYAAMPGFFGGFVLNPLTDSVEPVTGFAPGIQVLPLYRNTAPAAPADGDVTTTTERVNVAGSNWTGYFYRTDNSGYRIYLTASISQNSSQVSVSTSKSGIGSYLTGTINYYGDMLVYDSYDGEDWTTHYGPASYTQVRLYDYIWAPVEGEPAPPLNVIILYRPPLPPLAVNASDGVFKDKVSVNWNLSDGATSYQLYECSSDSTDSCRLLTTITTNHYDDQRETFGKIYYRVKACDELCSDYSDYDTGFRAPPVTVNPIYNLLL